MGRYDKVGQAAPIKSATLEITRTPCILKCNLSQAGVCQNGFYSFKWVSSLHLVPQQLRFYSFSACFYITAKGTGIIQIKD